MFSTSIVGNPWFSSVADRTLLILSSKGLNLRKNILTNIIMFVPSLLGTKQKVILSVKEEHLEKDQI